MQYMGSECVHSPSVQVRLARISYLVFLAGVTSPLATLLSPVPAKLQMSSLRPFRLCMSLVRPPQALLHLPHVTRMWTRWKLVTQ